MLRAHKGAAILWTLVLLLLTINTFAQIPYSEGRFTVTDLGGLDGILSDARGVNNSGTIVGDSLVGNVYGNIDWKAFVWDGANGLKSIGSLGGSWSNASAINNSGIVTGYSPTQSNNSQVRSYLWDSVNGLHALGTAAGGGDTYAYAINDSSAVVGDMWNVAAGRWRAFKYDSTNGMQFLNIPNEDWSYGRGINASGAIAGTVIRTDGIQDGYYRAPNGNVTLITNPTNPAWGSVWVNGLNDAGQVAHHSWNGSHWRTYIWSAGSGSTEIGAPAGTNCFVSGISSAGKLNGYYTDSAFHDHAYEWDSVGGFRDIGTLGGANSHAQAMSQNGLSVGYAQTASGNGHSFLYNGSSMTDIKALPGAPVGFGHGINNLGQAVGYGWNFTNGWNWNGFFYDPSTGTQSVGTLNNQSYSDVRAINNGGVVAGWSADGSKNTAVIWDKIHGMHALGTIPGTGGWSYAYALNDNSKVAGEAFVDSVGYWQSFLWDSVHGMQSLGSLAGTWSVAFGINNAGTVAGRTATTDGHGRAYKWDSANGMRVLDTSADSGALGINTAGDISGWYSNPGNWENEVYWQNDGKTAQLWSIQGANSHAGGVNNNRLVVGGSQSWIDYSVMHGTLHTPIAVPEWGGYVVGWGKDLNDLLVPNSGWTFEHAQQINDSNQIVGYGTNADGERHALILTPVSLPAISLSGVGVPVSSSTTAQVSASTNRVALVIIHYGETTNYTDAGFIYNPLTSFNLVGLKPKTTYNYQIQAVDVLHNSISTNNLTFTTKAMPVISSIAPAFLLRNSVSSKITIKGLDFLPGSKAQWWDGAIWIDLITVYVKPIQITATIPAVMLTQQGTHQIRVLNPTESSTQFSESAPLNFDVRNPLPVIKTLSVNSAAVGTAFSLLLNGTGFVEESQVLFNGVPHAATINSAKKITVSVSAADTAFAGPIAITVTNPALGGGTSLAKNLTIGNPSVQLSYILKRLSATKVTASITVKNTGPVIVTGVKITAASLTTSASVNIIGTPLPLIVSTSLAPGALKVVAITFTSPLLTPGSTVTTALAGGYNGGYTFSGGGSDTLP